MPTPWEGRGLLTTVVSVCTRAKPLQIFTSKFVSQASPNAKTNIRIAISVTKFHMQYGGIEERVEIKITNWYFP